MVGVPMTRYDCEYCGTISSGDRCPSCYAPRTHRTGTAADQVAIVLGIIEQQKMEQERARMVNDLLPSMAVYALFFGVGRRIWAAWRRIV